MLGKTSTTILLITIAAAILLLHQEQKSDQFTQWKKTFGITFSSSEDSYRRHIFLSNFQKMEEHNKDLSQTYKMGLNHFSALSDAEFAAIHLRPYQPHLISNKDIIIEQPEAANGEIDWTEKG
jgi:hypothetical protein